MRAARPTGVLVLAAFLAVYGNGVSLALAEVTPAGGWAGVGLGVVPAVALLGRPVTYTPLSNLSTESLLWRAFVWMPLDTALPEELTFRGVLLAALLRRFAAPGAVAISAVAFTLWHVVIVSRTVGVTNLAGEPVLLALGIAGSFVSVLIGGVLFAVVRLATGHLVGSIVAHWAFNAMVLLGLYWSLV
jgi:membrane protease YdiL (CAAX protease family)